MPTTVRSDFVVLEKTRERISGLTRPLQSGCDEQESFKKEKKQCQEQSLISRGPADKTKPQSDSRIENLHQTWKSGLACVFHPSTPEVEFTMTCSTSFFLLTVIEKMRVNTVILWRGLSAFGRGMFRNKNHQDDPVKANNSVILLHYIKH